MFYFRATRKPNFKNIRFFDYEKYWESFGMKMRDKLREREYIFIDWVKEGSKVLDIACGNSPLLKELKKQKKCEVKGFDVSSRIIEEQKKAGIEVEARDISDKNFRIDENYDYMIASETLEHIAYPEILLENIKPRTKYIIISIPNSAFYRYRLSLFFSGRFFTQWAHHPAEHLRFWSHKDFLDWLEALEFELVEAKPSNGLDIGPIKFYNLWPNLFGHQICYLIKGGRGSSIS